MFPIYLQFFFFGMTAFCLIRDRRVHRYLFSTVFVALTFGYSVLQFYTLVSAIDNGVTITNANLVSYLYLAEIIVSLILLIYVFVRAALIELPGGEQSSAKKKVL
jgi:uncharacterized membrane protein YidH (DUF202 family)